MDNWRKSGGVLKNLAARCHQTARNDACSGVGPTTSDPARSLPCPTTPTATTPSYSPSPRPPNCSAPQSPPSATGATATPAAQLPPGAARPLPPRGSPRWIDAEQQRQDSPARAQREARGDLAV